MPEGGSEKPGIYERVDESWPRGALCQVCHRLASGHAELHWHDGKGEPIADKVGDRYTHKNADDCVFPPELAATLRDREKP
jgi:hypothetical protein